VLHDIHYPEIPGDDIESDNAYQFKNDIIRGSLTDYLSFAEKIAEPATKNVPAGAGTS